MAMDTNTLDLSLDGRFNAALSPIFLILLNFMEEAKTTGN